MASPDLKFDVNTELAARRTGMAFQRTRLAEDRTLMAVIRTSLSLIGFGFTIFQFFQRLREQDVITRAAAPRNFGVALVGLGIVMLVLGIGYHVQFMLGLRHLREVDAGGGAHPWRDCLSSVADPDYGASLARDRGRRDHQHGVPSRTVRIGRRVAQELQVSEAVSSTGSCH